MPQTRVRIFVDFWNFQLAWNAYHKDPARPAPVKIPWEDSLPQALVAKVAPGDGVYVGTQVYASIDPSNPKDKGLSAFLHNMDGFPGYSVTKKERRPMSMLKCNHEACRKPIPDCPHCKKQLAPHSGERGGYSAPNGHDPLRIRQHIRHCGTGLRGFRFRARREVHSGALDEADLPRVFPGAFRCPAKRVLEAHLLRRFYG